MLTDDTALLDLMLRDQQRADALHHPGPYWRPIARVIAHALHTHGLATFRSESSLAGLSFVDRPLTDYRRALNHGVAKRALRWLLSHGPIGRVVDNQVAWTRSHAGQVLDLTARLLRTDPRVLDLLARYEMPASLAGGCDYAVTVRGRTHAVQYLSALDEIDHVAAGLDLSRVRTMLEIGGGFGANLHLLLTNWPGIRKVLYVDIPPTLYIGTQYLKAHFGDAVIDYRATKDLRRIAFRDDDTREILCLAPWQLPQVDAAVDLAWNAHSFVEMPGEIVRWYAAEITRLNARQIALLTYDQPDVTRTLPPESLADFFPGRRFTRHAHPRLTDPEKAHLVACSGGDVGAGEQHDRASLHPARQVSRRPRSVLLQDQA